MDIPSGPEVLSLDAPAKSAPPDYRLPPASRVPLPPGLRPNAPMDSPAFQLAADIGDRVVSPVVQGAERVRTGANRLAGQFPWSQGPTQRVARGAAEVVGGGLEAATPFMLGGVGGKLANVAATQGARIASQQAIRTGANIALGTAAMKGTEYGLEKAGVPQPWAELAGYGAGAYPLSRAFGTQRPKTTEIVPRGTSGPPPGVMPERPITGEEYLRSVAEPESGMSPAQESAEVFAKLPQPKSAAQSAEVFNRVLPTREAQASAKAARAAVQVPSEGVPEDIARVQDARERIAREVAGKPLEELPNSDRLAVDELVRESLYGVSPKRRSSQGGSLEIPEGVANYLKELFGDRVPPTPGEAPPNQPPPGEPPPRSGPKRPPKDRPPIEQMSFGETGKEDVSTFYNVDKMDISPEAKAKIKADIDATHEQLYDIVGQRLPNKEIQDLAAAHPEWTPNKPVTREQTAATLVQGLNARIKVAAEYEKAAKTGTVGPEIIDALMVDKSLREDAGRRLQIYSSQAPATERPMINAMLEDIVSKVGDRDVIIDAAKGVDFNDPEQATAFYRQFVKPTARDWLDLVRYNSMLSGPNTHSNNMFSNLVNTAVVAPVEKVLAGAADFAGSKLRGAPRTRFAAEAVPYVKGYASAIGEATKRFGATMSGSQLMNRPEVQGVPLTTKGSALRPVETALSIPMRALEASDQFFTALTEGGSRKGLEYRQSKGVKVGDVAGEAKKEAAFRLFRTELGGKDQGHLLNMVDTGANLIMQLRASKNPYVSLPAKFVAPFVRTPTNIVKQGIEYTPAGLATLHGNTNKTQQLAKVAIGIGTATGVAALVSSDRLTYAEPMDDRGRKQFREAGRIPYAVKIGDKWVQYSRLAPAAAFNFALVASIKDKMARRQLSDDQAENILSSFARHANFVTDQSYMKAVGDIVNTAKGSTTGVIDFLSNPVQQLIPYRALMSWVERLTDPNQRKADPSGTMLDKHMQTVIAQIPGLAEKGVPGLRDARPQAFGPVPPRLDSHFNPIPNRDQGINALSPVRISTATASDPDYQKAIAAQGDSAKARRESSKDMQAAEQTYGKLKQMEPDAAMDALGNMISEGKLKEPQVKHILDLVKKSDVGMLEGALLRAPAEVRAKHFLEQWDAAKTEADQAALVERWTKLKILTPAVQRAIINAK